VSEALSAFRISGGHTFLEAQAVEIIDQLQLPHVVTWEKVDSIDGAFDAIKSMKVSGTRPLWPPASDLRLPAWPGRDGELEPGCAPLVGVDKTSKFGRRIDH